MLWVFAAVFAGIVARCVKDDMRNVEDRPREASANAGSALTTIYTRKKCPVCPEPYVRYDDVIVDVALLCDFVHTFADFTPD